MLLSSPHSLVIVLMILSSVIRHHRHHRRHQPITIVKVSVITRLSFVVGGSDVAIPLEQSNGNEFQPVVSTTAAAGGGGGSTWYWLRAEI